MIVDIRALAASKKSVALTVVCLPTFMNIVSDTIRQTMKHISRIAGYEDVVLEF